MKSFRNVLILIIALILQVSLSGVFSMWQVFPNFILIAILAWCFLYDYPEALFWAFVGGFFLELYENSSIFGANIIAAILVISIASCVIHYIVKKINYLIVGLTGFLGTVLYKVLQVGMMENARLVESGVFKEFFYFNFKLFLWEGIINSMILLVLIYVLEKFKKIGEIEKFA